MERKTEHNYGLGRKILKAGTAGMLAFYTMVSPGCKLKDILVDIEGDGQWTLEGASLVADHWMQDVGLLVAGNQALHAVINGFIEGLGTADQQYKNSDFIDFIEIPGASEQQFIPQYVGSDSIANLKASDQQYKNYQ